MLLFSSSSLASLPFLPLLCRLSGSHSNSWNVELWLKYLNLFYQGRKKKLFLKEKLRQKMVFIRNPRREGTADRILFSDKLLFQTLRQSESFINCFRGGIVNRIVHENGECLAHPKKCQAVVEQELLPLHLLWLNTNTLCLSKASRQLSIFIRQGLYQERQLFGGMSIWILQSLCSLYCPLNCQSEIVGDNVQLCCH